MTTEEKTKAILERIKCEGVFDEPEQTVSVMVIIHYLDQLSKLGLVECAFNMTEMGGKVASICEEFDWQPSDEDVLRFVNEMMEEPDRAAFAYMIKRYRDDREGLLEEIRKFRESERGF